MRSKRCGLAEGQPLQVISPQSYRLTREPATLTEEVLA